MITTGKCVRVRKELTRKTNRKRQKPTVALSLETRENYEGVIWCVCDTLNQWTTKLHPSHILPNKDIKFQFFDRKKLAMNFKLLIRQMASMMNAMEMSESITCNVHWTTAGNFHSSPDDVTIANCVARRVFFCGKPQKKWEIVDWLISHWRHMSDQETHAYCSRIIWWSDVVQFEIDSRECGANDEHFGRIWKSTSGKNSIHFCSQSFFISLKRS